MRAEWDRERRRRRVGAWAVASTGVALVLGLLVAPADAVQGHWQRLMYLHVPAAWTAFLAFAVILVSGVAYLRTRDWRWDRYARAAAEVGSVCTLLALGLGSLWGRQIWGTWWAWDPRLVSTAALLAILLGCLGIRAVGAPRRAARNAALLGIAGFVDVPIVHFSVLWWRSLHQPPTFLAPRFEAPPVEPAMTLALAASVTAAVLIVAWCFLHRVRRLELAEGAASADRTGGSDLAVSAERAGESHRTSAARTAGR